MITYAEIRLHRWDVSIYLLPNQLRDLRAALPDEPDDEARVYAAFKRARTS